MLVWGFFPISWGGTRAPQPAGTAAEGRGDPERGAGAGAGPGHPGGQNGGRRCLTKKRAVCFFSIRPTLWRMLPGFSIKPLKVKLSGEQNATKFLYNPRNRLPGPPNGWQITKKNSHWEVIPQTICQHWGVLVGAFCLDV